MLSKEIAGGILWEDAGRKAVETASDSIRDVRVAEVVKLDIKVENGKVAAFRARVALSFKLNPDLDLQKTTFRGGRVEEGEAAVRSEGKFIMPSSAYPRCPWMKA